MMDAVAYCVEYPGASLTAELDIENTLKIVVQLRLTL